jgi:hypothetical protein
LIEPTPQAWRVRGWLRLARLIESDRVRVVRRLLSVTACLGMCGVGCGLVGPPAKAATPVPLSWSAPRMLDPSVLARQPRVALTNQGEILVAWTRQGRVFAAVVSPGGSVRLARLWENAAAQVLLTAAPDGHALLSWTAGGRMHAAYRQPGGSFQVVAVPGGQGVFGPGASAMAASGTAVLVWQRRVGRQSSGPIMMSRCGASSRCGGPRVLARTGRGPAVGIDKTGGISAAWISGPRGRAVSLIRVPATGGKIGSVQTRSAGGSTTGVHLQVGVDGSAVLAWGADTPVDRIARASYRPAGGALSAPFKLTGDLVGFAPVLSAPVDGRWWTTFQHDGGNPLARYQGVHLLAADVTSGDSINEPIDNTSLTSDATGDAMVAVETDSSVQTTFADPGGAASALSSAGPSDGEQPSIDAFPQGALGDGRAALVWLERPPYDPDDYAKAISGRVVVATATLPPG